MSVLYNMAVMIGFQIHLSACACFSIPVHVCEVSTPAQVMKQHTLPLGSVLSKKDTNPIANTQLRTSQPSAIITPLIEASGLQHVASSVYLPC